MRTLETRYALALFELIRDEEGLQAAAALLQKEPSLWQALKRTGCCAACSRAG